MQIHPTTLVFEIVNFVVLVWLLRRLLYRPLRDAIVEREQMLAAEREEAEGTLQRARALEQGWQVKHQELSGLADQVRDRALATAAAEQRAMLARAREEAAAERSKAEALLRTEREAAEAWVRATAIERSTELAGEMLLTLAPSAVDTALTERLIEELRSRGPMLVRREDDESVPSDVEVTGARSPEPGVLDRLRRALADVLAEAPRLIVREDPSLRAGLQLRIGDSLLDASLSGKLRAFAQLARELADGSADG